MSNATKDHITDRGFAARPIYLTDLDRCQPAGALSPEPAIGRWKTVSYATDELAGVMVAAGTETAAPDITYPLNVPGWHAVSVGVWADHITPGTTRWYGELRTFNEVQIKRSGDDTFSILTLPGREWGLSGAPLRAVLERRRSDGPRSGPGPGAVAHRLGRFARRAPVGKLPDRLHQARATLRRRDSRLAGRTRERRDSNCIRSQRRRTAAATPPNHRR